MEDLDKVYAELIRSNGQQWVYEIKENPWGQRDIRVYDPDKHTVEIAEAMDTVIKRFFRQRYSFSDGHVVFKVLSIDELSQVYTFLTARSVYP